MSLSDRELDAKVAERVTCLPSVQKVMTAAGDMDWMYSAETPPRAVGEGGYLKFVPWYSTTGDGMLAVILAMKSREAYAGSGHWQMAVDTFDSNGPPFDFRVEFFIPEHEDHRGEADTLPRAVCLAALSALGVKS